MVFLFEILDGRALDILAIVFFHVCFKEEAGFLKCRFEFIQPGRGLVITGKERALHPVRITPLSVMAIIYL